MIKYYPPVVGLDVGTAKTTACLAVYDCAGRVEIQHAAMVRTRGVRRGIITNIGEAAQSIESAVRKIDELKARTQTRQRYAPFSPAKSWRITCVHAAINGDHILGNNVRGMITMSSRPAEITAKETLRVLETAKSSVCAVDRDILHTFPLEFSVDGHTGIKNPVGIYGTRLGVHAHVVSGGLSFVNSLTKAVNRAGLDVDGMVFSGLASGLAVLAEAEKQSGVILLELGAGAVNILFFSAGMLCYSGVLPGGGEDITQAVAQHFGVDPAQAEQLKIHYHDRGLSAGEKAKNDEKVIIKKADSRCQSINRQDLSAVIDEQTDALISGVSKELQLSGIRAKAGGIVVCGGTAFMEGVIEKLERQTKLPVRMAALRGFVSNVPGVSNIFYAAGIGTAVHALREQCRVPSLTSAEPGLFAQMAQRVKTVYEEYF